jgi:glutamate dehydrogenase (NAD(P)+)
MEELTGGKLSDLQHKLMETGPGEVDIVNSGLEEIMVTAYHHTRELMKMKDVPDLRTASFVSSVEKIATSYIARGIFP